MPNNEFGDFQTPRALALQCLRVLGVPDGARVLEPTCGRGSFLEAAAMLSPASDRIGVEINEHHAVEASRWGRVTTANVFQVDLPTVASWETAGPLVVVGNPPWVTSAELKRMDSKNVPPKENIKKVKGLDALLGSSNFDVCEYVILKALREFSGEPFALGVLCKTQVARNVIEYAANMALPVTKSALYRINSMKWFRAGVDACWFTVEVDSAKTPAYTVDVREDVFAPDAAPTGCFGVVDSLLVSDVNKYNAVRVADGKSPYEWRSGLKHDASSVFELTATPEPAMKSGERVDLESDYVFPYLKSTDVFRGRHRELSRWVIVPQMSFGAETDHLRVTAPRLWKYLEANASVLDGRKSSIYRNRPRFSVFGHGAYTFAPYKIAVSGLHKQPVFQLVAPLGAKPVVLDDTCYMLSFEDGTEAAVVAAVLNSPECIALIESLVFWDSKRPITKKLLSRLDLNRLAVDKAGVVEAAWSVAQAAGVPFELSKAKSFLGNFGVEADLTPAP